jgi:hypothetical protein
MSDNLRALIEAVGAAFGKVDGQLQDAGEFTEAAWRDLAEALAALRAKLGEGE